jgi:hypothetical protein
MGSASASCTVSSTLEGSSTTGAGLTADFFSFFGADFELDFFAETFLTEALGLSSVFCFLAAGAFFLSALLLAGLFFEGVGLGSAF